MNVDKKIEELREEIIHSTQELIKIRSVEETAEAGMPFGKGVNDALEYALALSRKLGFKVRNIDGYGGHAEFGDGEECVGILVHLDVVPEGSGWTYPPYGGEIHEGKIYGRGAIDDKGPAVAALYAMKVVMDAGLKLNKRVRIIFGTDEETGWDGIKHYFQKEETPTLAFTPDADFPVIHAEKGILIFDLEKEFKENREQGIRVKTIKGGNRPNMVPDYCEAVMVVPEQLQEQLLKEFQGYCRSKQARMELFEDNEQVIVKSYGVSSHGSLPESGVNAISQLMLYLNTLPLAGSDMKDFIALYRDKIGMEYYGESIGCGFRDDESGRLIFNVGMIEGDESKVSVSINIRYPVTYTDAEVYNAILKALEGTGIQIVEGDHKKPLYVPKEHELVQKLMKVYWEETGDEAEPIAIGGGTYARALDNAVAFGPLFPGQTGLAHQKDECIGIEDLLLLTKIYAKAIYELAK